MSQLENGEVTDLEYQTNQWGQVHVCSFCRKIFDSAGACLDHMRRAHEWTDKVVGADVQL